MKFKLLLASLIVTTSHAGEVIQRTMVCDETSFIVKTLKETYQEMPVIIGKVDDQVGSVLSVWTNPTNDSWTIIATDNDFSCVIGSGQKLKVIEYRKNKV